MNAHTWARVMSCFDIRFSAASTLIYHCLLFLKRNKIKGDAQDECTIEQDERTIEQDECTIEQDECTIEQDECTIEQDERTIEQDECTIEQEHDCYPRDDIAGSLGCPLCVEGP
jgi:hypothetical protein